MTSPLPQHTNQTKKTVRSLLAAAAVIIGFAAGTPDTLANTMPDARPSLKGLSEDIDFGKSVRDRLVEAGLDAIGTRYTWGGDDPSDGFDCSGLVAFVYREIAGVELPRRAVEQRAEGEKIQRKELAPGDLVFFATTRRAGVVSHVGIYIGDNKFVHAPRRGATVRVDEMDGDNYWSKRYLGARAYLAPDVAPDLSPDNGILVAHNAN